MSNQVGMLLLAVLVALAVVLSCALVFIGLTYVALLITRRLGVEPLDLLLWLGLAERPIVPRSQRVRLNASYATPVPAPARRLDPQTLTGA